MLSAGASAGALLVKVDNNRPGHFCWPRKFPVALLLCAHHFSESPGFTFTCCLWSVRTPSSRDAMVYSQKRAKYTYNSREICDRNQMLKSMRLTCPQLGLKKKKIKSHKQKEVTMAYQIAPHTCSACKAGFWLQEFKHTIQMHLPQTSSSSRRELLTPASPTPAARLHQAGRGRCRPCPWVTLPPRASQLGQRASPLAPKARLDLEARLCRQ